RALVLRVVLETLPLEVLHQVARAIRLIRLYERLGYWQAELLNVAPLRPVAYYRPATLSVVITHRMPGLREPLLPAAWVGDRLERRLVLPVPRSRHPQQT